MRSRLRGTCGVMANGSMEAEMLDKIKGRIEELQAERDELVRQANLQVAAINGAIAALESLLVEDEPVVEEAA